MSCFQGPLIPHRVTDRAKFNSNTQARVLFRFWKAADSSRESGRMNYP